MGQAIFDIQYKCSYMLLPDTPRQMYSTTKNLLSIEACSNHNLWRGSLWIIQYLVSAPPSTTGWVRDWDSLFWFSLYKNLIRFYNSDNTVPFSQWEREKL